MDLLKRTLPFLLWYLATGITILIVAIIWLATWQDSWSPTMLGNRILVVSLLIAFVCEGLRRKKGTNDLLTYFIFPITVMILGLAGWLLRYSIFALFDLAFLLIIYLCVVIFLLLNNRKSKIQSPSIKVSTLDPLIDAEVRRVAAQFMT